MLLKLYKTIKELQILNKNIPINLSSAEGLSFFFAIVSFVLLDDSDKEKFDKYGGWKGIGTVECYSFINNNANTEILTASPINPNIGDFPIVNELVLVVRAIDYTAQDPLGNYSPKNYYFNSVSVWNQIESNAISKGFRGLETEKDFISLFKETGKVSRTIKAPGDNTIEGRSGNIVRLGSSIDNFNSPYKGSNRSPFISVVNKQFENENKGTAVYEDVNKNGSSLYMLNGQNTGVKISSFNFDSYRYKVKQDVLSNYIEPVIQRNNEDNLSDAKDETVEKKELSSTVKKTSTTSPKEEDFSNKKDPLLVFVAGLDNRQGDLSAQEQFKLFLDGFGKTNNSKVYRYNVDAGELLNVVASDPECVVVMFSKGCEKLGALNSPSVNLKNVYLLEPYAPNNTLSKNIIDSKIPTLNIYVGPSAPRGNGIATNTSSSKAPYHFAALRIFGSTLKQKMGR